MAEFTREQNELAGPQGLAKRSDASSNKALTPPEASTLPKAPISPFFLSTKDLFTKFMKAFVESTQAWDQEQSEPRERPLKARSPQTYSGKSHKDCYHFCQQYEDHFKTSSVTEINYTSFAVSFFRGTISLRWAQHKRCHQSATPITWSKFQTFLWKNLGNSRAFINNI